MMETYHMMNSYVEKWEEKEVSWFQESLTCFEDLQGLGCSLTNDLWAFKPKPLTTNIEY